jgi:hypothetical protein
MPRVSSRWIVIGIGSRPDSAGKVDKPAGQERAWVLLELMGWPTEVAMNVLALRRA